jgi:hypothetical protein
MAVSGHLQSPNSLLQSERTSTPIKHGYRDFADRSADTWTGNTTAEVLVKAKYFMYIVGKHTSPHRRKGCNPTSNNAQKLNSDSTLDATGYEI